MPALAPGGRLAIALAAVAATVAAAGLGLAPPSPRPATAPPSEFSAERALAIVRDLAGDGAPRPAGTEAGARATERLRVLLEERGFRAEVQDVFACGVYGACARVRNVVGRLGAPGPKAVLLVAHHDSVGAGPGAADDASGVAAVLEAARALSAGPAPARPIIALLTDSEETGLVGATAFVERHPWAGEVGAIVNAEARGTEGASIVFDTAGDPTWLVPALRRIRRPIASSLFSAVYDLVPNDTDLTALERSGLPGVNLAFAQAVVRYHTPLDDVRHLDASSLQHQGESLLALARALAGADLEGAGRRPMAFFDVLGAWILAWPARAALPLSIAAALAVVAAAALLFRLDGARPAAAWGFAGALAAPLLAAGTALAAWLALRQGPLPRLFVAHPAPFVACCWTLGAGAALLCAAVAARRAGKAGLFAGSAAIWAMLAVAIAATLPGAAHVATVPALACGLSGLSCALGTRTKGLRSAAARAAGLRVGWLAATLVPAVAGGLVLFPAALLLPAMLGIPSGALVSAAVALVAFPLAPLVAALSGRARFVPALALLAAAFVLAGVAAAMPHATEDAPERLAIAFHEEGGRARLLVEAEHDALPPAVRALAPFPARRARPFPWAPYRRAFIAPAEPTGLAPPRLDVLSEREEGGVRRIRARMRSQRGAPVIMLLLPPSADVASFAIDGVPVPPAAEKARRWFGGHRLYATVTSPPEGVEIEVALRGAAVEAVLVDQTRGLPPAAARLAAARPRTATTSQDGDLTLASAPVRL